MTAANNITTENLKETITLMDTFSHRGFSEITAITKLMLQALESKRTHSTIEDIAQSLNAILGIADTAKSCVTTEAEQVDCEYKDNSSTRRRQAEHAGLGEVTNEEA